MSTQQLIPRYEFDSATFEGLELLASVIPDEPSDVFSKKRVLLHRGNLPAFGILGRYIERRGIDFYRMREAATVLRRHVPALEQYEVATEAATELYLTGKRSFISDTAAGKIEGRISALHNSTLPDEYKNQYLTRLQQAITETNVDLWHVVDHPLTRPESGEFNFVTKLVESNLQKTGELKVGMVNEINARLRRSLKLLSDHKELKTFVGFADLSDQEKYKKLSQYFNRRVMPETGSKKLVVQYNLSLVPVHLANVLEAAVSPAYLNSGLAVGVAVLIGAFVNGGGSAMLGAFNLERYSKYYPLYQLSEELGDEQKKINPQVRSEISDIAEEFFGQPVA